MDQLNLTMPFTPTKLITVTYTAKEKHYELPKLELLDGKLSQQF